MRALLIDQKDTVAVVVEPVNAGDEIRCAQPDGTEKTVKALEAVPVFHKVSVTAMKKGQAVVKYGEHIGAAAMDIQPGQHVHVHNVESVREAL